MGQISETDKYLTNQVSEKTKIELKLSSKQNNMATFSADGLLPSPPLPNLEDTLRVYLDSVKPFLTRLEYLKREKCVEDFKNGIGKKLHFFLAEKANKERNWVFISYFLNINF